MTNESEGRTTENELFDLLPGYIMGILEPDEMLSVNEYLHAFPHVELRIAALEETIAALAFDAPVQSPTSYIKSSVLERANASLAPQRKAIESDAVQPESIHSKKAKTQSQAPSALILTSKGRGRDAAVPTQSFKTAPGFELLDSAVIWWQHAIGWKIATAMATAAAIVMLAILLQRQAEVSNIRSELAAVQQDLVALQSENSTLASSNETLEDEVATQQETLAMQQEALVSQQITQQVQMTSILGAQQAFFLGGTADAPQADGSLFVDENNAGTLVLSGLAPLPTEQTYQLWLIPKDSTPVPAGLFAVNDASSNIVTLDLPLVEQGFTTVGISIEPATGSQVPTGPIVLFST